MTLIELAEPIFQQLCRLNRLARLAGAPKAGNTSFFVKESATTPRGSSLNLDYAVVRSEVKTLLDDFLQKAGADVRLAAQAKKMEMPLLFFIDSMIAESTLPFAAQWNQNRLAYERNELAGDEKFFDLLDETMKDSSEEASERLAVFYTCLGLGFTGIYFRQPEFLRKTMLTIAPRIRKALENDESARICPDSYEGVDTRDLIQPPGRRMALVGMVFLCLTLATILTYVILYRQASQNLSSALFNIEEQDLSAKPK